jgi:hypothetical protein
MTPNLLAMIALDIARERTLEADRYRLARSVQSDSPGALRRGLARVAASVSSAAASVARRLDEDVLDGELPSHTATV